VVTIADREADIYDLFATTRRERSHLLIRGTHNRRVDHEAKYLHASIEQAPIGGFVTITVPRSDQRPQRQATLTVRFATLEVQPPSLQQAVGWIAQLGGFLGRKHDGEPGVKTIWRGWQRLQDIAATWQLLHS